MKRNFAVFFMIIVLTSKIDKIETSFGYEKWHHEYYQRPFICASTDYYIIEKGESYYLNFCGEGNFTISQKRRSDFKLNLFPTYLHYSKEYYKLDSLKNPYYEKTENKKYIIFHFQPELVIKKKFKNSFVDANIGIFFFHIRENTLFGTTLFPLPSASLNFNFKYFSFHLLWFDTPHAGIFVAQGLGGGYSYKGNNFKVFIDFNEVNKNLLILNSFNLFKNFYLGYTLTTPYKFSIKNPVSVNGFFGYFF